MGAKQCSAPTPSIPDWCDQFWNDLKEDHSSTIYRLHDYGLANFFGIKNDFVGPTYAKRSWKPMVFARQQTSGDEPCGSWLHKHPQGYAGAFHHDFAVAPEWGNTGQECKLLVVPPGIEWLEGTASTKHTFSGFWPGGGTQVYLPQSVVRVLDVATHTFCQTPPTKQTYEQFLTNCKAAFSEQQAWKQDFEVKCLEMENEAKFHNRVKELVDSCSKISNAVRVVDGTIYAPELFQLQTALRGLKKIYIPEIFADKESCKRFLREQLDYLQETDALLHKNFTFEQLRQTMVEHFLAKPYCDDSFAFAMMPKCVQNLLTQNTRTVSGNYQFSNTSNWLLTDSIPNTRIFLEFSHTEHTTNTIIHWFRIKVIYS